MMNTLNRSVVSSVLLLASLSAWSKSISIPEVSLAPHKKYFKTAQPPLQTTHFTAEKIKKSPAVDLSQFLRQEQSIVRLASTSGDSSQTALSLRGFGDNAVANSLILIDGFPLTNPSLLAPNFNSIPLGDIDHIDIFQGSQGTLWGDQAVGGVVSIVTKHPQRFFANAMASVGSFHKHYLDGLLGNKAASGIFFKTFVQAGETENYRDHNTQRNKNGAVQVGYDYASGTLAFNVQSYATTSYFPGGLSLQQFKENPRQATSFKNFSHFQTTLLHLLNKQELNANWILETRISYDKTDGNGFMFLNMTRADKTARISPRLIGSWNHTKIITGYDAILSSFQIQNSAIDSRTAAEQHNLYLQTITPVSPKLDVILGSRYAWQKNKIEYVISKPVHSLDKAFVTETGINYHPSSNLSLFLRRDGNFSFPKANEELWAPVNEKSLKVQTGVSYETGVQWQDERQHYQASVYRLALNDEIAFNPTQTIEQPFGSFYNFDQTLRYGVTLTGSYHVTPRMLVESEMNYVHARFAQGANKGKHIPNVPDVNGNFGLNYAITEQLRARYALLYTGSRYGSDDVANVGKKIPAYWLHDVALEYGFKHAMLSFEVINLFNKNYPAFVFYSPDTNSNSYYPGAGRNYSLTLKVNLD